MRPIESLSVEPGSHMSPGASAVVGILLLVLSSVLWAGCREPGAEARAMD